MSNQYSEMNLLVRNDIIKWILSYNIILIIVYSWIIWKGTRQADLFKFGNNIIMLVFGVWSISFATITVFASKYFKSLEALSTGISKDYDFIVLIKFSNDLWVFMNWFYIGICKSRTSKKDD